MAILDHILACNRHDLERFRPLWVGADAVGWVRHDMAAALAGHGQAFVVEEDGVRLRAGLDSPQQRSQAIDTVCRALDLAPLRGERYRVSAGWGQPVLFTVDRAVVSLFGVRAYGVHVNGFVRDGGRIRLWIAKRATDKAVAPGKLDNLIAGGQPAGLTLMDNLVKEAAEEADIPATLARTARPVGAISYCHEDRWGLKPDTMFCYDLEVPPGFIPRNTDGEVESFTLMDLDEVAERLRTTTDFKFNVNLVITDFLVRHGVLNPDSEPDYTRIVRGLRQGMMG
jgi:8-oxo-dGTP pyrophosphatase MutT (NUDIX family)